MKRTFKYYLKANRPLFGAIPPGFFHAERFRAAIKLPRNGYAFGVAYYENPLTEDQILKYDLKPDRNNPRFNAI